jgi:hypothetical protein
MLLYLTPNLIPLFRPIVFLADGSLAVSKSSADAFPNAIRAMCWAHMWRIFDARIRNLPIELKKRMIDDVHILQVARDLTEFDIGRSILSQ